MNEQRECKQQAADAAAAALLAEEEAECQAKQSRASRKAKAKAKAKGKKAMTCQSTGAPPAQSGDGDTSNNSADLPSTSRTGTPSAPCGDASDIFQQETRAPAICKVLTEEAAAADAEAAAREEREEERWEEGGACGGVEAAAAPRVERNATAGVAAQSKQEKERERKARQRERKAAAATQALENALEEVESHGTGSGCLEVLNQAVKEAERFTRDSPNVSQLLGRARIAAKAASLEHLEEDMAKMAMANQTLSSHDHGSGALPPC
eukprot:gene23958-29069_t